MYMLYVVIYGIINRWLLLINFMQKLCSQLTCAMTSNKGSRKKSLLLVWPQWN